MPKPVAHIVAGTLAGALASLVTHPADVVKTRLQVLQAARTRGTFGILLDIARTERLTGLFRGASARIVRRTLMAAINWSIYEQLVHTFERLLSAR